MRILLAALLLALSALIGGAPARAADLPQYDVPEVDYGLSGGFYLRGSAAGNLLWTRQHIGVCGCDEPVTGAGYGYSLGVGFGYEFGNGLRVDSTYDYLANDGLTDGTNTLHLRAGVALANAYYDFSLGGGGAAGGGFGGYVGGGIGAAYYTTHTTPVDPTLPDGSGWSPAIAAQTGLTYDTGTFVADLGYRLLYLPQISNNYAGGTSYYLNDNFVHEIRGTLRYRLK